MLKLQVVKPSDAAIYNKVEEWLVASFPREEYRPLEEFRRCAEADPRFTIRVALDGETAVGFITSWNFGDFCYVEHFAIDPGRRGGGYGTQVLACFAEEVSLPVALEVELPVEETARRRVAFYRRQGFTLWQQPYEQPPYRKGDSFLPMHLMVRGDLQPAVHFEHIRRTLYREVYHVND